MLDSSNSKYHINSSCSNHMKEQINKFSYFTPQEDKYLYIVRTKVKLLDLGLLVRA